MWPFKKNRVLDLTNKPIAKKPAVSENLSEYNDLTSPSSSTDSDVSGLGFLGSLASSASSSPSSNLDESGLNSVHPLSVKHLKVKIEDIEYKIDSLRKKVDSMLDRLDLAEKKIGRNERLS